MDNSLSNWINGFAGRTEWAHDAMAFYVDNGVVLFAALLLVGYLIARQRGDLLGVAGAL